MLWICFGCTAYLLVVWLMFAGQVNERRILTALPVPGHARHAILVFSAFWPIYFGFITLATICMKASLLMFEGQRMIERFLAPPEARAQEKT